MRRLYRLGPLLLDPQSRVLTHEGAAVPVGARAVAVLTALVSKPNEYVEKSAILDVAWPGLVVEEANLAVQISTLRRALGRVPGGEGWIETLPRRGYRFVGPVAETDGRSAPPVALDRKRTNLPEQLSSFVGRAREMAEIKQLLPSIRLLTLTGTGGIGKTRLAQQAGAEVLDAYRHGVWFVDLAPLVDPTLVARTLSQLLGVKESGGQPLVDLLCDHLRAKELLLILDNCEHVLDSCARLIEPLLRETTQVTIVATSREALHLSAERAYPVTALPLPDPKASAQSIAHSDAVQLFVERARQHRPRFDLQEERARVVAQICVHLDGIPLALELAAARIAALPAEEIARLLNQRFRLLTSSNRDLPRHQTLRAMMDWSYELLDQAEKALFARLSVFAGGWTLAAAEAVCGGKPIAKNEVVYVLIGLIEQSLVVADEDGERYRMLETVREYAKDKLQSAGEVSAVREQHGSYYLVLALEAEQGRKEAEQGKWLKRLDRDVDNLRSALDWSIVESQTEHTSLRLCAALYQFWMIRGHISESREWCARALATNRGSLSPERARVLLVSATAALIQADYDVAKALYEDSRSIRQQLGDSAGVASALLGLGNVAYQRNDYASARAIYEKCLAIQRQLGDRGEIANTLHNLGMAAEQLGDPVYIAMFEECLALRREAEDLYSLAQTLDVMGRAAHKRGDDRQAQLLLDEAQSICRELGDRRTVASMSEFLGDVAYERGDYTSALALYRESLVVQAEFGDKKGITTVLASIGEIVSLSGMPLRAACIWGMVARMREELRIELTTPRLQILDQRRVGMARATVGDAAFNSAWQEGRSLSLEQVIELALDKPKVQL